MAKKQGVKVITRRGIWLATNPNGHDWLWKRFVSDEKMPKTDWFRSTSFDNPFLPQEYLQSLLLYPKPWIQRYVLCQFDDFAGQIYEDWNYEDHVVTKLPDIPSNNVFWMGMDPGTRNPTAGLWVLVDPDTRTLIATDEYQGNAAAVEHARLWRQIEAKRKMNVRWRVADPNVNTRDRGTNMMLSDQYGRLGFYFDLGPRRHADRIPMLQQLITLRRFKVTENAMQTYEQIKNYRWEDITPAARAKGEDPKETPHKENDHLVDCAQYLASRWVSPRRSELPLEAETFSSRAQKTIRKQLAEKRLWTPNNELGTML